MKEGYDFSSWDSATEYGVGGSSVASTISSPVHTAINYKVIYGDYKTEIEGYMQEIK